MSSRLAELSVDYTATLASFLQEQDEEALRRAAALGRQALSAGFGLLDLVMLHHESLSALLAGSCTEEMRREAVGSSAAFLCEALSSFEMTHRGFKEVSRTVATILQFAATVVHELRTPLTSIINSVGMLEEVLNLHPESTEGRLLANIIASTQILKSRTNDLADIVGFQSGTFSLKLRSVDVRALISALAKRMGPEIDRAGVELHLELPPGIPAITADPERLDQVVTNLIQNALKYGSDGNRIDVRAYATDESVVIEVKDYGMGVSLRERIKIFQPNYRGSRATEGIPGFGLGLALCAELVRQHYARKRGGKGKPLSRGAASPVVRTSRKEVSVKVLVMEDSEEVVESIKLCVSIRWPECTTVSTPKANDGVRLVETESPDAVILDLTLLDGHGLDASSPEVQEHYATTIAVLEELGVGMKPIITVSNKIDAAGVPISRG